MRVTISNPASGTPLVYTETLPLFTPRPFLSLEVQRRRIGTDPPSGNDVSGAKTTRKERGGSIGRTPKHPSRPVGLKRSRQSRNLSTCSDFGPLPRLLFLKVLMFDFREWSGSVGVDWRLSNTVSRTTQPVLDSPTPTLGCVRSRDKSQPESEGRRLSTGDP